MTNKVYNFLKWFTLIFLNAFGVFYNVIAETWKLPYASEITTTCDALGTFLGVLLGISCYKYYKVKENIDYGDKDN